MNGPAIVTGAGRGLGAGIAAALVLRGWQVTLVARSQSELDEATARLGDNAVAIAADVSDPADVARMVKQSVDRFGVPGTLVNNAAVFGPIVTLVESDPERWFDVFRVNTFGAYLCMRELIALMPDGSQVLAVSSGAALGAGSHHSAYASSKAALESLHRQAAAEHPNLRFAVLDPGGMGTRMMDTLLDSGIPGTEIMRTVRPRMRPPEHAGEVVAQLLVDGIEPGRRYQIDELDPAHAPF